MYVYMMSTYGEHGAENCRATLDRGMLPTILSRYYDGRNGYDHVLTEATSRLETILRKSDEDLSTNVDGTNLTYDGWGGVQLFVIALEP